MSYAYLFKYIIIGDTGKQNEKNENIFESATKYQHTHVRDKAEGTKNR